MRYAVLGTGSSGAPSPPGSPPSATRSPSAPATPRPRSPAPSPTLMATRRLRRVAGLPAGVTLATFADAAAVREVLVNATSGRCLAGGADRRPASEHLAGKLLLDVANPLDFSRGMPPACRSATPTASASRSSAPSRAASVVKTLNTMNAAVMVDPSRVPGDTPSSSRGDDAEAKAHGRRCSGVRLARDASSTSATSRGARHRDAAADLAAPLGCARARG